MTVLRWLDRQMDWGWGWWLAVAACCAWIIGSWVKRRMKSRALSEDEPRCARCGYIIMSGIPVCPECGTDVRRGGLLTPSVLPPPPASPWVAGGAADGAGGRVADAAGRGVAAVRVGVYRRASGESAGRAGRCGGRPPIAIVSAAGNGRYGRRVPRSTSTRTWAPPLATTRSSSSTPRT